MSGKTIRKRHIVCVDDTEDDAKSNKTTSKAVNASNIFRLKNSIRQGQFADVSGVLLEQHVYYYQVEEVTSKFSYRASSEQQIHDIAFQICKNLERPEDEIFLFGSGRGAFIVRAVAGVLHHMNLPRPGYLSNFADLYQKTLDLMKARREDNTLKGSKAIESLRVHTQGRPNIRFVGLFDTDGEKDAYDTTFVQSIQTWRHALGFNESKKPAVADTAANFSSKELQGRSFIRAWFLGTHQDMLGGTVHDGLSIYPLQWILIEANLCGLALSADSPDLVENPLAIAFPQFTGGVPNVSGSERIQWQIEYTNGICVSMFDLHSIHVKRSNAQEASHVIHFDHMNKAGRSCRPTFDRNGLIGYDAESASGTIVHPSVFCIFDRNQHFLEQKRFKFYKPAFADFEDACLKSDPSNLPPWLAESQLLASGVKAFRILVCGKTGVGKSTLINKVFGVEMTEESTSYAQGNHDINQAFESPNHPGLLIHDSRGWQAGSDQELDLIAQFLRHRAYQKEPAEALHVIWFCVDSDVSRIEEADKRTFETIAQYSNHVPVFVIGTKKDKLVNYRKMQLLEQHMQKTNDYQESLRLANSEADKAAQEQFMALRDQLSQIKSYKADGYVCLSKDDDDGVKILLSQTLDMILDERVRIFCVAAQVVDVNKKIDSAITECMRLGTHAIRTAMVPLPFSGLIGTPTVSRIICEHVLQCFGFPKALPDEVEEIMQRIVMGSLKQFMTVSLTQFALVGGATIGLIVGTAGVGALLGVAGCFLSTPPTARMLLKVSCDMILILERSFRYNGKYVSVKQIEDAAKQYTKIMTTTFGGSEKQLQVHVHDEIDRLIPLKKLSVGFKFAKLRTGFEQIIYRNRFDRPPAYEEDDPLAEKMAELDAITSNDYTPAELPGRGREPRSELSADGNGRRAELSGTSFVAELEGSYAVPPQPNVPELPGSETGVRMQPISSQTSEASAFVSPLTTSGTSVTTATELSAVPSVKGKPQKSKSDGSSIFSRMSKSMKIKKTKSDA